MPWKLTSKIEQMPFHLMNGQYFQRWIYHHSHTQLPTTKIPRIMWAPDLGYPSGKQRHIIQIAIGKKNGTSVKFDVPSLIRHTNKKKKQKKIIDEWKFATIKLRIHANSTLSANGTLLKTLKAETQMHSH